MIGHKNHLWQFECFLPGARIHQGPKLESSQLPRSESEDQTKGFSLIELPIVVAIILIIAAIAIPNLRRSRIAANEASAVSSLRTLNTACITFNSTYGQYSAALSNLKSPTSGNPRSTSADLVDQVLAAGQKSGYNFTFAPGRKDFSYSVSAIPISINQTGLRGFFTDQSGVIGFHVGVAADVSSTPLQ